MHFGINTNMPLLYHLLPLSTRQKNWKINEKIFLHFQNFSHQLSR